MGKAGGMVRRFEGAVVHTDRGGRSTVVVGYLYSSCDGGRQHDGLHRRAGGAARIPVAAPRRVLVRDLQRHDALRAAAAAARARLICGLRSEEQVGDVTPTYGRFGSTGSGRLA